LPFAIHYVWMITSEESVMILEIAAGIILANVIAAIVFVFWRPILWLIGTGTMLALLLALAGRI
jgi:hypothetical protein